MGFLTKERKLTDMEKLKAAYMLNLCTVSVSQIIDYNDMNIMEQEYNAILNNLNLQEMPKDEAFLKVLKELLNTITFFRIQEGDKKFIEHEYQQKMKNAIWSSVPNLSVIVATGNPVAMAVSLAAQAGISYMNYRKTKAQNLLEKEKQEWQLQRAAIEQFNVIRRELFDTAWRIADKYNFPDNYRLTENQIKQFNEILMDANLIRKYERLEAIEDNFIAYPPFWYHYGNTANAISIEYKDKDNNIYETYRQRAISYFEHFDTVNLPLLREDQLAASCELEYVDLLDPGKDKEKILKCINKAKKLAGRELDVLQLCAFAYQRVGAVEDAENLFRMLVNENYNKNTNAQILSRIYVAKAIANKSEEEKKLYLAQYELLKERQINSRYLFPMELNLNENELMDNFVQNQKEILSDKMELVIDSIFDKYGILFNKVIPKPNYNKDYEDSFYSTSEESNKLRKETYESELSNLRLLEEFKNQYVQLDITLDWLDILNNLLNSLCTLESVLNIDTFTNELRDTLSKSQKELKKINGTFEKKIQLPLINQYNFNYFTDNIKNDIKAKLNTKIKSLCKLDNAKEDSRMNNLSMFEGLLRDLCNKEKIKEPEILFDEGNEKSDTRDNRRLPVSLLGDEAVQKKIEKDRETVLIEKIREFSDQIANGQFDRVKFYFKNEETNEMGRYFAPEKLKSYASAALAVMDFREKGFEKNDDLIFTKLGILYVHNNNVRGGGTIVPYSKVDWNNKKELCIGLYEYKNKVINTEKLYELCNLLAKV